MNVVLVVVRNEDGALSAHSAFLFQYFLLFCKLMTRKTKIDFIPAADARNLRANSARTIASFPGRHSSRGACVKKNSRPSRKPCAHRLDFPMRNKRRPE